MIKTKVPARYLMPGDRLCTGETVVAVTRGARTPSGKVEVTLDKDGNRRTPVWNSSTTINVVRPANPVSGKVEALGLLLSELAKALWIWMAPRCSPLTPTLRLPTSQPINYFAAPALRSCERRQAAHHEGKPDAR
jgi:hypothetical protein